MSVPILSKVLPAASEPTSFHEVVQRLENQYEALLATGNYEPFLYPWGTVGAGVVILYLLLDHRQSWLLRQLRWPVWLFNVYQSLYTVLYLRARNPAGSLGVGIICGWSMLWTANMLIFDDCQRDYVRIEKRQEHLQAQDRTANGNGLGISTSINTNGSKEIDHQLKARSSINGHAPDSRAAPQTGMYFWQQYPTDSFYNRLDWVLDCFTTFRGTSWNWRISGLAPPPPEVESSLSNKSNADCSKPTRPPIVPTFHNRTPLLRHNTYLFIRNVLFLDILKTLISHDPYFWGIVDTSKPPPYLPNILHSSPVAKQCARLLIALGAMKFALELIFTLGPLFFVGILGPSVISVRGEAWDHPDQFGSISFVYKKGLAGWWGGFWHQTFRKGFEAPGQKVVELLGLKQKSAGGRVVQLFVAFGLSGLLHACGSTTQIGETRPFGGPFLFFVSQAVGITLEMGLKMGAKRMGWDRYVPGWLGGVGNFVFAHWWLYLTAPLMVEDFAKGGVWLFEPLPVSLFRGPLRLGDKEDGFWRWTGTLITWHSGETWWKTGIAL